MGNNKSITSTSLETQNKINTSEISSCKKEKDKKIEKERLNKKKEKLMESLKESQQSSLLEKLPKNIICLIITNLDIRWINNLSQCNKYLLRTIFFSENSNIIWRNLILRNISDTDEISLKDMNYIEEYINQLNDLDLYERELNKYLLFYKHNHDLLFDENRKGPSINVTENGKSVETGVNVINSWNSILGNKKMSKGIHFVEISTDLLSLHFIYFVKFKN
eukprot:TRINITY_DN6709_c0_g1_i2.p1 TRINITY_DN6709_c0_g1~~TRINITY_DN6709_c0_g1_i2.p1  ORF type:complete len:221 (-),score=39.06 TRINITY_DN6709_c0_g1_i2:67-729(-)